ncbi:MAG TPA: efflux RND transporter periplasmic adaptor subunit [Pirellulales bacterium]|nr:efflux RND transporter periplasmic adaptor subunit [Pirellulales bacterium]
MSRATKVRHTIITIVAVGGLLLVALIAYPRLVALIRRPDPVIQHHGSVLFKLKGKNKNILIVSEEALKAIHLETTPVEAAPEPDPLLLPGYLSVDPNRLVPIHSRFPGQVVELGRIKARDVDGTIQERSLRYGDPVKQGDLLAIVWSTDIGQKKSELVDALSKLSLDETILMNFKRAPGAVPQLKLEEARRNLEADKIQVNSARRTLTSWRLEPWEIDEVEQEAKQLHDARQQTAAAKTWSELPIRSPRDGVVLEKNVNVGEVIDTTDNLFKIADLTVIQVLAYVYEEDLPVLEQLKPEERHWKVDLKSDPNDPQRPGMFQLIGDVLDSVTRTGPVIGWIPNTDRKLRVNQFVTATINLPADPTMVAVPTSALVEEGGTAAVFVETNPVEHEITRRVVAVTRRGKERVFVRSEPNEKERQQGAEPLKAGEHVVMRGGLKLDSELNNLLSTGGVDTGEGE